MKKFLVFTIVLLNSCFSSFACGYSPYGEDIRYSLFLPEYFNYSEFNAFHYNSQLFGFNYESSNTFESNVYDWHNFTQNKVSLEAINECLNEFSLTDIHENSSNAFLKYLYQNKKYNVIRYLLLAKNCEDINSEDYNDLWEREDNVNSNNSKLFLNKLLKTMQLEKSAYLKRKYAFLIIRTAHYAGDKETVSTMFDKYFKNEERDYLYFWSLYFNCFLHPNAYVAVADVMANSPEKTYAAYYYFHSNFKIEKALEMAKTKEDIANIYAYASVQKISPNLNYLKKIYANSNQSKILSFLLLREINKMEDWVYTPYYTNFLPSIEFANSWYENKIIESTNSLRLRSEKDRLYAKQVLDFVNSVDLAKVENAVLWKAAQIQLLFMTRQYEPCLQKIAAFEKQYSKEKIFPQIEKLKAICITANQKNGNSVIKEEIKPIILKYKNDERFLFTLGRELEFIGNIQDGLALIALGNNLPENYKDYTEGSPGIEWQGNRLNKSGNLKYFYEYFDYLDFVYSANQMQVIINKLNTTIDSDFEKEIYSQLLKDKNYLKDLLGTKYFRENRLKEAQRTFRSVNDKYWNENYNAWERDKYKDEYCFEENPFYDFKHTEHFIPHKEKYLVTKLSVTEHLIKYVKLANNPKTTDRDYYCFLVANCYYNMTQYGHSWMMRRFNSTYSNYKEGTKDSYIDEMEYRNGELAQKYYQLAYQNGNTDKFKALCLKMIARIEDNKLRNKYDYDYQNDFEDYDKMILSKNRYSQKLLKEYGDYYLDLSNCENLEEYFQSRR